jgi:fructose-1,6-bisphosphatase/inositol monophosphatase family enzyme
LANSDLVEVGEQVAVLGAPEGWHDTATVGRVSNINQSLGSAAPSPAWNDVMFVDAKILTRELKAIFPQAEIYGEENGGEIGSEYTWLIDPIDGTKHFAHKMPSFFVQVSLLSNRDPIIGIIYDPVSRQLFSASLGNGSFLNGEKLINKSTVHLSNAVIDVDLGGKEDIDWKLEALKNLVKESYRVRVSAGRFAPYLLTGGISAFVVLNPTTKSFDQLPRVILAREAGFTVVDMPRNENSIRIMGNKIIVDEILGAIGLK